MRFACKIALCVVAVTLIASYASATVINGQFRDTGGGPDNGPYTGPGAYPDGTNYTWNNLQVTGGGFSSPLKKSLGMNIVLPS
jgi:hypothetical protein